MRVRELDPNGDYLVTGTSSEFLVNSAAAVGQLIQTGLALYQGEWFLDATAGVPWTTEVLGKVPQPVYDGVLKNAILNVSGVNSITAYSSSLNAQRQLTVAVSVHTVFGPISLTINL